MSETYDCIVIGGGPAGSTVATLVAQKGHKTLLVERSHFPRFHIGESLMPETYWVFKRLNMLQKMKESHFVKKYSVQFTNAQGKDSAPFYFDAKVPHECSQTWQIVRSEFDKMMLDNAAEHGVDVWEETNVSEVLFEPGQGDLPKATGVVVTRPGEAPKTIRGQVIVDATGTNAMISKKLGIRKKDPKLRKAAIFSHFKGAKRDEGKNEGATLVISTPNQDGWFWYIPLPNDIVSVGVVAEPEYLFDGRGTPEQVLEEEIAKCKGLEVRMANATRQAEVRVLSDFSYRSSRCAGKTGYWRGTRLGFSIRSIRRESSWRSRAARWRPTRSSKHSRSVTSRPSSWVNGARNCRMACSQSGSSCTPTTPRGSRLGSLSGHSRSISTM